ncbi:hypothetical protein [Asticcacaulis excentricus]|uniref:hypothetical protein n=1 Tax=Asticcacaulis excentricus TaxID=78587 RepID=UPI00031E1C62|nr:hypothetical protein [Asticcacaulis excentricus]
MSLGFRAKPNFTPVVLARGDAFIAVLHEVAPAEGVSVAQVALSWLLHQKHVAASSSGPNARCN